MQHHILTQKLSSNTDQATGGRKIEGVIKQSESVHHKRPNR